MQFLYLSPVRGLACYLSTGTSTLQNHQLVASTVVFSLCVISSGLMLWTCLAWVLYGHEEMKKRGEAALEGAFCSNMLKHGKTILKTGVIFEDLVAQFVPCAKINYLCAVFLELSVKCVEGGKCSAQNYQLKSEALSRG